MPFNIDKCNAMHVGFNNPNVLNNVGGTNFQVSSEKKDLGPKPMN
jgi:hypothetical protein